MNHLVIMAGGVGSRLTPISTTEHPKQFIDVMGVGRTFIQLTYDRFESIVEPSNVWIVTNEAYADIVHEQLPDVPKENILLEPCRRNTAPCIAYVSYRIKAKDRNANIVVSPADHIVMNVAEFRRVIGEALRFTSLSDAIVTLGMKPTRAETGYGYIKADLSAASPSNEGIYRVDSFREKPDLDTATRYISDKSFFWNSGVFIWNVNTIVNALRVYQPDVNMIFEDLLPYYGTEDEQAKINEMFPKCTNISIDYAVLEKADEIFVMPASFGWSDVGTWGSLITLLNKDENNNALVGSNIKMIESSGCMIHLADNKRAIIQGLKDCIVAEKDGMLLICQLSEEQRIKQWS